MKLIASLLLALVAGQSSTVTPSSVNCGETGAVYATLDQGIICILFPSTQEKVVFTPIVDKFESLQIKGLWSHFASPLPRNLTMIAVANGLQSREVIFQRDGMVAPIVNLVVTLTNGEISSLDWKNSCYEDQCCDWNNCKDTSLPTMPANCDASNTSCDTQVYLTWTGVDKDTRGCVSDDFRLTAF